MISLAALAMTACSPAGESSEETLPYRSVWAELYPDSLGRDLPPESLQGAFYLAAAAESQADAERRWEMFLTDWGPADGEFEDAMHARLVTWAEMEMQRLRSLQQNDPSAVQAVSDKLREYAAQLE